MATLKNSNISDTGFLQLPSGTTAQRPTGAAGKTRYNSTDGKPEIYNGGTSSWKGTRDDGVIANNNGDYVYEVDSGNERFRVHVFTTVGTQNFTVTRGGEIEYLIVGGGGGGGDTSAGGGGGGGVVMGHTTVTAGTYPVVVGAGGVPSDSYSSGTSGDGGYQGGDSSFNSISGFGGGGGGSYSNPGNRIDGGSGGGVRGDAQNRGYSHRPGLATQTSPVGGRGYGNNGGDTPNLSNGDPSGGGGGAGAPGIPPTTIKGGDGGIGIVSNITGVHAYYGGGGGGSGGYNQSASRQGTGGLGGGGNGGGRSRFVDDEWCTNGRDWFGGGGGGNGYDGGGHSAGTQGGGYGGSGVVVLRYPIKQDNPNIGTSVPYISIKGNRIRDGLIVELDAANPNSYRKGSTKWYDLSGNGNHFDVLDTAWNWKGYFDFNGSYGCAKNGSDISLSGDVTYVVLTRIKNNTGQWRTLTRSYSADHHVIVLSGGWEIGMYDNNGTGFNSTGYSQQSLPGYPNNFDVMIWRWTDSDNPTYDFNVNGVQRGTISNSNARYNRGFGSIGAYHGGNTSPGTSSQPWGDIAYFAVYNRRLTDEEVYVVNNYLQRRYPHG